MVIDPTSFDPFMREIAYGGLKLDIGSGGPIFQRKDSTWTTVDRYCKADIQADMGQLPFRNESVEAIWSSHALEHQPRAMVLPILGEWYRVLQEGGRLTLLVPNMDYVIQVWIEKGMGALDWIFGSQDHAGEFHQTGWNLQGLQYDVESVGFKVDVAKVIYTPEYTQESIWLEATK